MASYDPAWLNQFAEQAAVLTDVLAERLIREIEHIGSTAVPGLCAKPIIDMLAVVDDIDAVEALTTVLAGLSWVRDPETRDATERRLSFCHPTRERRTHHLHVVLDGHGGWRGWLAFRDRLRCDAVVRSDYANLKQRLAAKFGKDPNDRERYRAGKAELIQRITSLELEHDPGL